MTLVLDAGALLAVERSDRDVMALIEIERRRGAAPVTHGGVVGQAWRGGARQALLARMLPAIHVVALDEELGRRAGSLLAESRTADVIDAAIVLLASDGDDIVTSDPDDLAKLADAAGIHVEVLAV